MHAETLREKMLIQLASERS